MARKGNLTGHPLVLERKPQTDDLCGVDKHDRVPRLREDKRPFAPTPQGKGSTSSADQDGDDSEEEQISVNPITAATSGAENSVRKQNLTTSRTESKKPGKVLPQPVAATNGAENKREKKLPLPGENSEKQVLPKPIAAALGADNNGHRDVPVSSDKSRTSFDYNSRKLQLLTLPGFQGLPERLLDKILPRPGSVATTFLNNTPTTILVLDAGLEAKSSVESTSRMCQPALEKIMVEIDVGRNVEHDILNDNFYKELCEACCAGRTAGITCSPPRKTWDIMRHSTKTGAPGPVRDRSSHGCWGTSVLTEDGEKHLDRESLSLLRPFYLLHLACESGSAPGFFMEHPADPCAHSKSRHAQLCSSWWCTEQCTALSAAYTMGVLSFKQRQLETIRMSGPRQ